MRAEPNHPLPWQVTAWQRLRAQSQAGRLAHAYLLIGSPGSGRERFAHAAAAQLLCERNESYACGKCRQCLLYAHGTHPDVLDIVPEDGSSVIKIDQVREISEFVQQTANQPDVTKVVIIHPAEGMGVSAANALLKNLEEPPGKTLFLLVAERGGRLLPTIRSRCQPLDLPAAEPSQAMAWMTSHSAASVQDLEQALALAPGSPLLALQLLEQGIPAWRSALSAKLEALEQGADTPLSVARHCEKLGDKQVPEHVIRFLQTRLAERARQAVEDSRLSDLQALTRYQQILQEVYAQLNSGANPNGLLSLEYLLAHWRELKHP